ncbi:MAG TPA: TIR domain-containing protein [Thermoanaerobaculia bacterium]|jgi:hypothetical protein|nr:TIR domain-containing protein [Thermoanaerobaculia bacterium]
MKQDFDFDVFVSHSSTDQARARRLAKGLQAAGLRVWFDEWSIAPGDDIYLAIERGLEHSRTQVLCLSNAALGSDWVGLERSTALFRDPTNKARRFVPVLLEDCELPDTLRRYRYIYFSTESKAAFTELVAACKGENGSFSSAPEAAPPASQRSSPPKKRASAPKSKRPGREILPSALLAAGGFVVGLAILWLMLAKAELLTRFGLTGQLYYVLLLPLGLGAAAFLFGAMRSYASFRGKAFGGVLELGGPVVVFCLVVLGGFKLVPPITPFALTVFVHGPGGVHDLPLRGKGVVILDLGPDRRREAIGEKGQAQFASIPATFRGQEIAVGLEADGFDLGESSRQARLDSEVLYLEAKPRPFKIRGRVLGGDGRPVPGARLRLGDLPPFFSDPDGRFSLEVPGELAHRDLSLSVSALGFESWQAAVVPGSNDVDVSLVRAKP